MKIFRITKSEHANLDGVGGLMVSGRWHEKGIRIVYFSENRSLAVLEYLAHIGTSSLLPSKLVLMTLVFSEKINFKEISIKELKKDWQKKLLYTRNIGSKFLKENKNLFLRVPSVIMPDEYNFLFNPLHPDSKQCTIFTEPFLFDERIYRHH